MRVRPLIITNEVKADVARVIAYAERERIPLAEVREKAEAYAQGLEATSIAGNNPLYRCVIPLGYRAVFTIDEMPEPLGWVRHLSVGLHGPGSEGLLPGVEAVDMIAELFGFVAVRTMKPPTGAIWIEEGRAINLVQQLAP